MGLGAILGANLGLVWFGLKLNLLLCFLCLASLLCVLSSSALLLLIIRCSRASLSELEHAEAQYKCESAVVEQLELQACRRMEKAEDGEDDREEVGNRNNPAGQPHGT
mmetsp:Transcript_17656/g.29450  ORF Transcript_17656/g.29450 Transcript_17656/m.29450 type:complete len:108 (+) Transcript_17656:456-779(+)